MVGVGCIMAISARCRGGPRRSIVRHFLGRGGPGSPRKATAAVSPPTVSGPSPFCARQEGAFVADGAANLATNARDRSDRRLSTQRQMAGAPPSDYRYLGARLRP